MSNHLRYLRAALEVAEKYEKKKAAKSISFFYKGKVCTENAVVYNDQFYEIVGGVNNGSLVHVWDIAKESTLTE